MITELAQPFDMSLPAVSKHLRVLEKARLVRRTVKGRVHMCALDAKVMGEAEAWLGAHRIFWQQSLDSFAHYMEIRKSPDP
jgi:DNA-binding transcriptional ArsR family regulator